VFSGIVGDASHTYGFHCSARQLGWNRSDYSLADADNWAGAQQDGDAASAFDVSMSTSDMRLVHGRVHASWSDTTDDRLSLWYEHIGTLDGSTVSRLVSYPPLWGGPYSSDSSHLWHEHTSALRNHVHDQAAMAALYSVWAGQTYQQWLQSGADDQGGTMALEGYDHYSLDSVLYMLYTALATDSDNITSVHVADGTSRTWPNLLKERLVAIAADVAALKARPPLQLTDAQVQQLADQILDAYDARLDAIEASLTAIQGAMAGAAAAQLAVLGEPAP
jgi:hypothetical protein